MASSFSARAAPAHHAPAAVSASTSSSVIIPPPRRPPMRLSHAPRASSFNKVTRIVLTNAQKLELCEYSAAHPALAWDELAVWAAKRFRLRKPVSTTTVYRTLRSYESLQQLTPDELASRHTRKDSIFGEFEARLRDWIVQTAAQGLRLSGKTIKAEAHRLRDELDTEGLLANRAFSNGWLANFQSRHDISLLNLRKGGSVIAPDRPRRKYRKRPTSTASQ